MKKTIRKISIFLALTLVLSTFSSCAFLKNKLKNIKGELVGNSFTIDFYDNYGSDLLTIHGNKVGLEANYVSTDSIDSDGSTTTNYELSSVVTLTVDGSQIAQTGNTIIFAENGITKLEDFALQSTEISTSGGSINLLDRKINKLQNLIGTPKIVIVCSQLGIPIAVYGGNNVYWEIPDDLPKTTKLNIDGKALYIHRTNYILLDSSIIDFSE